MSAFSEWLVETMADREKTQTDLYRAVGVSSAAVSRWVSGEDLPRPLACAKIALALGVPAEEALWRAGYLPQPRLAPRPPEDPIEMIDRALTLLRRLGYAPQATPAPVTSGDKDSNSAESRSQEVLADSNPLPIDTPVVDDRLGATMAPPYNTFVVYREAALPDLARLLTEDVAPMSMRVLLPSFGLPTASLPGGMAPIVAFAVPDDFIPGGRPGMVVAVQKTTAVRPGRGVVAIYRGEPVYGRVSLDGEELRLRDGARLPIPSDGLTICGPIVFEGVMTDEPGVETGMEGAGD